MGSRPNVHVFGVRHLSPAGAWHLLRYLDEMQPDAVLVEGMADCASLIDDIVRRDTVPPIAALAYTEDLPVRTLMLPLASYSPEYQAMKWAVAHDRRIELIDLPSEVFLALPRDDGPEPEVEGEPPPSRRSTYEAFAAEAGEPDYDTYWERRFEHNAAPDSYRLAALALGEGLRAHDEDPPRRRAELLVREAYMRRRIEATIADGVAPDKIVAVVGAFHAPVLGPEHPAMTDAELASLPTRQAALTLMPYSYFRLSAQSGYGAGNRAPQYFQMMWQGLAAGEAAQLPARYLSEVARTLRDHGTHRSTAEVIEGVRLARTLSAMQDGLAPTLTDLRDAAVTLLGHGELSRVAETLARVDVGTAIGRLPDGVSRTSIQADFDRRLHELRLDRYRTAVKKDLILDLRENRRAKTEAAAFLDLRRSAFLHQLRVLGVSFGALQASGQADATWKEMWHVQWTPEAEIELVESVLLGETVELATALKFTRILEDKASVADAAGVVYDACRCGMVSAMEQARARLQALSAETSSFSEVASAASQLSEVVRYGDVRKFDTAPLLPLIEDLFVQGAAGVYGVATCDDEAARAFVGAMDELEQVCLQHHDRVDEALWLEQLRALSDADDKNPRLSGYACSILLERSLLSQEDLSREVARRLSPGAPADLGAGWFEGLASRNRYALIARQPLWAQLADYVAALDDEEFRRAVVFLRRAFGGFSAPEKRQISENLGEHWGVGADAASEVIAAELTEDESAALEELADFDFDDV